MKTIRKKKFIYDKDQSYKLENVRTKNAKTYWRMLRGSIVNKNNKCNLSSNDFQQYFKAINDPESIFYQPDEDVLYFNKRYLDVELNIMFSELNVPFSNHEIIKACNNLHLVKSAGSGCLLNEFFKYGSCCNDFVNVLNIFFNKIFDVGYFPSQ